MRFAFTVLISLLMSISVFATDCSRFFQIRNANPKYEKYFLRAKNEKQRGWVSKLASAKVKQNDVYQIALKLENDGQFNVLFNHRSAGELKLHEKFLPLTGDQATLLRYSKLIDSGARDQALYDALFKIPETRNRLSMVMKSGLENQFQGIGDKQLEFFKLSLADHRLTDELLVHAYAISESKQYFWNEGVFEANVKLVQNGDRLDILIPSVNINTESLKMGQQQTSDQQSFGRFFRTIIASALLAVEKNPAIREIDISAQNVVNFGLGKTLARFGFRNDAKSGALRYIEGYQLDGVFLRMNFFNRKATSELDVENFKKILSAYKVFNEESLQVYSTLTNTNQKYLARTLVYDREKLASMKWLLDRVETFEQYRALEILFDASAATPEAIEKALSVKSIEELDALRISHLPAPSKE